MKFRDNPLLSNFRLTLSIAVLSGLLITAVFIGWSQRAFASGSVTIDGDIEVAVEVASTAETREKGLSGRDRLGPGQGMLFVFVRPDVYTFWMKDMLFPIDILWIRGEELVDITTDVPVPNAGEELPTYFSKYPADKVLEVPAGFARQYGLRTGMTVVAHIDSGSASR